jgi:hypothetical protein
METLVLIMFANKTLVASLKFVDARKNKLVASAKVIKNMMTARTGNSTVSVLLFRSP